MRIVLGMPGMCLDSSMEQIRSSLEALPGVIGVECDMMTRTLFVEHDGVVCGTTDLERAVRRVGYQVGEVRIPGRK